MDTQKTSIQVKNKRTSILVALVTIVCILGAGSWGFDLFGVRGALSADYVGVAAPVTGSGEVGATSVGTTQEGGVAVSIATDTATAPAVDPETIARLAVEEARQLKLLEKMVLYAMGEVKSKISEMRRFAQASMLARVALEHLDTEEERVFWFAILGRESKYDSTATSTVGAVGLGQIMPKYAKDFAKMCGYPTPTDGDLRDDRVNALLSACYFKALIKKYQEDVETATVAIPLAVASYNAGPNSQSVENFKNQGSMVPETANYASNVWKIAYAIQRREDVTEPSMIGPPAIKTTREY